MNKLKLFSILLCALYVTAGCGVSIKTGSKTFDTETGFSQPGAVPPDSGGGAVPPDSGGGDNTFKLSCEEARFTHLINIYRASKGLAKLMVSKNGVEAARWHGQDMIAKNYFSHTEPDGRSFSARTESFGYSAWAENIAAGNSTADATFCQWKNSPGHNSNMQSGHSSMGIGIASGGGTYGVYWSNCFGGSVEDSIAEPLTSEPDCTMPVVLPGC